jgi:hypothetical protein
MKPHEHQGGQSPRRAGHAEDLQVGEPKLSIAAAPQRREQDAHYERNQERRDEHRRSEPGNGGGHDPEVNDDGEPRLNHTGGLPTQGHGDDSQSGIKVSVWQGVSGQKFGDTSPEGVCNLIRSAEMQEQIAPVRELYERTLRETGDTHKAKKAVDPLKKDLPAVQWSGVFDKRGDAQCERYSGLLVADLDDLEPKRVAELCPQFVLDKHCHTVFKSPTGYGLKLMPFGNSPGF